MLGEATEASPRYHLQGELGPGLEPADAGWHHARRLSLQEGGDGLIEVGGPNSQGCCAPLQKLSQCHLRVEQAEAKLFSYLTLLALKEHPGAKGRQQWWTLNPLVVAALPALQCIPVCWRHPNLQLSSGIEVVIWCSFQILEMRK